MTQLWPGSGTEGFETGDFSNWYGTLGSATVISSDAHSGTFCAAIGAGSGVSHCLHTDVSFPASGIYSAECWLKVTSDPAAGDLVFETAGDFEVLRIRWDGTNWRANYLLQDLSDYVNGGSFSDSVLTHGAGAAWHKIVLTTTTTGLSAGQHAKHQVYVDGTLQTTDYDTSAGAFFAGTKPFQVVCRTSGTVTTHYDDVRTADADLGPTNIHASGTDTLPALSPSASAARQTNRVAAAARTLQAFVSTASADPVAGMPVISRSVPAHSNADPSYPPSRANDGDYSTAWLSVTVPSTTPVYLAYDLSGVASAQRKSCIVVWYNDSTGLYWQTAPQGSSSYSNEPRDYQIQSSADTTTGGDGTWTTLATVSGNTKHSRQHLVDLTGFTWVRLRCTAANGATGVNDGLAIQMDVHDAHLAHDDSFLILGDSITQDGLLHNVPGGGAWTGGSLAQLVNAADSTHFPLIEDGGVVGQTLDWAYSNRVALLQDHPGTYVALAYGTNDANAPNLLSGTEITNWYTDLLALIDYCTGLGKKVILPHIPWGVGQGFLAANAATLNGKIDQAFTDRPSCIRGPDFYTFYSAHQSLIRGDDGIHPTYLASQTGTDANPGTYLGLVGYEWLQRLWKQALLEYVYELGSTGIRQLDHAVGAQSLPSLRSPNVRSQVPRIGLRGYTTRSLRLVTAGDVIVV